MKIILDDVLSDFDSVREQLDKLNYADYKSPVDGVVYPGICPDVPPAVEMQIREAILRVFWQYPANLTLFLRLSTEGMKPPHAAHNDQSMGDFVLMMGCTRKEFCQGGTSFVDHKESSMRNGPINPEQLEIWEQDTNNRDKWQILDTVKLYPNKAIVFPTSYMHWAEQPYAFGTDATNGRLMLIGFFGFNNG